MSDRCLSIWSRGRPRDHPPNKSPPHPLFWQAATHKQVPRDPSDFIPPCSSPSASRIAPTHGLGTQFPCGLLRPFLSRPFLFSCLFSFVTGNSANVLHVVFCVGTHQAQFVDKWCGTQNGSDGGQSKKTNQMRWAVQVA